MSTDWKESPFTGYLNMLYKHMKTCATCSTAEKLGEDSRLCDRGNRLCVNVARGFEGMKRLRKEAYGHGEGYVYACPDLSKHDMAYQMTATLFTVEGVQEGLF